MSAEPAARAPLCVLTLEAGAEPDCLERVHGLVDDLWERVPGLEPTERYRFETAVVEAAGNIVEHAVGAVRLQVRLAAYHDAVEASFCDTGATAVLDAPSRLPDELAEQGRGLALAAAAVDEVAYERVGSTNRWRVLQRRRR